MNLLRTKRIYAPASPADGVRVLVDALWPRGLRRDAARLDAWCKAVAPSAELRRWFAHSPERWPEFVRRYHADLDARPAAIAQLCDLLGEGLVTLLYAAREERFNNAVALKAYLERERWAGRHEN